MALKKVKRPVLRGPNNENDKKLEHEHSEEELNKNGKGDYAMEEIENNNFNSNEGNLKTSLSEARKATALDRVISFGDDSVSMPRTAKIEEGVYGFRIDNITVRENVETQYGRKDQYVVSFSLAGKFSEPVTRLSIPYNISSNQQSALMTFLGAFMEVFRGQKITIGRLIGLIGEAHIYHVVSETGNVFERIEILSVRNPNT